MTVNQDILRAVGLVRTLNKPLKVLGAGDLSVPLFVVADAFTASARAKIEAAGGSVNVLEVPSSPLAAIGVTPEPEAPTASDDLPAAKTGSKADKPAKPAKSAKPSGAKASATKASAVEAPTTTDDAPTADPSAAEAADEPALDEADAEDLASDAGVAGTPSGDDA
jgi:hypothetical protein